MTWIFFSPAIVRTTSKSSCSSASSPPPPPPPAGAAAATATGAAAVTLKRSSKSFSRLRGWTVIFEMASRSVFLGRRCLSHFFCCGSSAQWLRRCRSSMTAARLGARLLDGGSSARRGPLRQPPLSSCTATPPCWSMRPRRRRSCGAAPASGWRTCAIGACRLPRLTRGGRGSQVGEGDDLVGGDRAGPAGRPSRRRRLRVGQRLGHRGSVAFDEQNGGSGPVSISSSMLDAHACARRGGPACFL